MELEKVLKTIKEKPLRTLVFAGIMVYSCVFAYEKITQSIDEIYFKGFWDGVALQEDLYKIRDMRKNSQFPEEEALPNTKRVPVNFSPKTEPLKKRKSNPIYSFQKKINS